MSLEHISLSAPLPSRLRLLLLKSAFPLVRALLPWAARSPQRMRRSLQGLTRLAKSAPGVHIEHHTLAGRPAEKVYAQEGRQHVLYLHGGAYVAGNPQTHRSISTHLARDSGSVLWVLDYRLAPEHPYPASLEDAVAAYQALREQGIAAADITLAGDSAGGGLALAVALSLRDRQAPLPGRLLLLSPWTDLTQSAQTLPSSVKDMMLSWSLLNRSAHHYTNQPQQPYCSPLFADLSGLPPTLILVGTEEILLSDSTRLQAALEQAGVTSRCLVYRGMWHVFPALAGQLAEADHAMAVMADWIGGDNHRATGGL